MTILNKRLINMPLLEPITQLIREGKKEISEYSPIFNREHLIVT